MGVAALTSKLPHRAQLYGDRVLAPRKTSVKDDQGGKNCERIVRTRLLANVDLPVKSTDETLLWRVDQLDVSLPHVFPTPSSNVTLLVRKSRIHGPARRTFVFDSGTGSSSDRLSYICGIDTPRQHSSNQSQGHPQTLAGKLVRAIPCP